MAMLYFQLYNFVAVVVTSFEESSLSVNESAGSYMACVIKDLDTIKPVTVEIFDADSGLADRALGKFLVVARMRELEGREQWRGKGEM